MSARDVAAIVTNSAVVEGWPSPPEPLRTSEAALPYPLDVLPGAIAAAVKEVQAYVQAPSALIANCALSLLAVAGQSLADVQIDDGLRSPTSVYLMTIAESGERKTSADSHFSIPLAEFEADQWKVGEPDLKRWRGEHARWLAQLNGVEASIRKAAAAGKPTADLDKRHAAIQLDEPLSPRIPQLRIDDAGAAALGFRLATKWPAAALLTSEGGSLLGAHSMKADESMGYLALINRLWDGLSHLATERRSSESYVLRDPRFTLSVQVQADPLREFQRKVQFAQGQGFFARFLVACPESTQGTRMYRSAPNWTARDAYNGRIRELLEQGARLDADGRLPVVCLHLSASARAAWIARHDEIERMLAAGGELTRVRDFASKAGSNIARLAALFHVFQRGAGGAVDADSVEAAAAIIAWHLNEARRFFGGVNSDPVLQDAELLEAWLCGEARNGSADVLLNRVIQSGPSRLRKKAARDRAVAVLAASGRVRCFSRDGAERIAVHPAIVAGELA